MQKLRPCPPGLIPVAVYERYDCAWRKKEIVHMDMAQFLGAKTNPYIKVVMLEADDMYGKKQPDYLWPAFPFERVRKLGRPA